MHRGIPIKAFYPHTEITAQTPTNNIRCELPRIPNHIAHNSQKPSRKTERRHDLIHKHKNSPSRHFIQRQKLQLKHIQTNNIICKLPSVPNRIAHNSQKTSRKIERQHDLVHKHEDSPSRHSTHCQKPQLQHPETTSFCEFPRIPNRITHNAQKPSQRQRQTQELIASTAERAESIG